MIRLNTQLNVGGYLFAAFIAVCAYKILMAFHMHHIDILSSAAYGVIEGKPHWLSFQNRLLGPYLVLLISQLGITHTFAGAWKVFNILGLLIESLLLFHLLKRENLSTVDSMTWLIVFLFFFLVLQHSWFYTWDIVDLVIFTLFAYGVVNAKTASFYVVLFLVGILNRESALFIAVFLLIDAFKFNTSPFSIKLVEPRKFILGNSLLVSGVLYTKYIRSALFISKASGEPDTEHELIGNHYCLITNLKDLFFNNFFDGNFIYSIGLLLSVSFFAARIPKYGDGEFKCFLMLLVIIGISLVFARFNETRVLFILLPLILFLWIRVTANGE